MNQPPTQRQVNPSDPQDAIAILRAIIFSPSCTLTGDLFLAAVQALDTLQAEVARDKSQATSGDGGGL